MDDFVRKFAMSGGPSLFDPSNSLDNRSSYPPHTAQGESPSDSGSRTQNARNRTGCLTCKRRKKKCDEGRPVCNNCLRTSYVCEGYPPVRHFGGEEESQHEQGEVPRSAIIVENTSLTSYDHSRRDKPSWRTEERSRKVFCSDRRDSGLASTGLPTGERVEQ